jgi:hypothetical protein
VVDIRSTVERRKRLREDVTALSKRITFVIVISEYERLVVVGFCGNQDGDELHAIIRKVRGSKHEHRATFVGERVTRLDDVATL